MWSSSGQRRECGGQRALTRQRLDEVPTAKSRVDRYFLLVPRIVRPKRSPLLTGSPWALALPRVHKRLEYLDRRGRSAIHLERRRGADPPDAAPVRE